MRSVSEPADPVCVGPDDDNDEQPQTANAIATAASRVTPAVRDERNEVSKNNRKCMASDDQQSGARGLSALTNIIGARQLQSNCGAEMAFNDADR
jgi:hypothetical protein